MSDETPHDGTRGPASPGDATPVDRVPPSAADREDPDEALQRLQSMSLGAAGDAPQGPAAADASGSLPPRPAIDPFRAKPREEVRPLNSVKRIARPPASGGSRSKRLAARILAPVIFLVAVIVLLGIVVDSGLMRADEPAPNPTSTPAKTGGASGKTKKYVVRKGDSLSSIAERFDTTTSRLQELNPSLSGTTVIAGEKIVVPVK